MQGHVGQRIRLERTGVPRKTVAWREGEVIFSQGDDADDILYVVNGLVKVSAPGRREAVVRVLGSDDFFGEECSCEQRLARTLLIPAGYRRRAPRKKIAPRMSQDTLAGIVGRTRSRVNYLLQKFKALGFIHLERSITVDRSLLRVSPHLRSRLRNRAAAYAPQ
jgi:CRP-like cAMP-binding protein